MIAIAAMSDLSTFAQDSQLGKVSSLVVYNTGGRQTVICDQSEVAVLRNKRYFTLKLAPGDHVLMANGLNEVPLRLAVEASKTYYIRYEYSIQVINSGAVHLEIGNTSFRKYDSPGSSLKGYKPIDLKDIINTQLVSAEPVALPGR